MPLCLLLHPMFHILCPRRDPILRHLGFQPNPRRVEDRCQKPPSPAGCTVNASCLPVWIGPTPMPCLTLGAFPLDRPPESCNENLPLGWLLPVQHLQPRLLRQNGIERWKQAALFPKHHPNGKGFLTDPTLQPSSLPSRLLEVHAPASGTNPLHLSKGPCMNHHWLNWQDRLIPPALACPILLLLLQAPTDIKKSPSDLQGGCSLRGGQGEGFTRGGGGGTACALQWAFEGRNCIHESKIGRKWQACQYLGTTFAS